jgi:anthranilate synthase component 1
MSYSGNMDFAIAIRTLVAKQDTIYVQAGAGIVADSVPALEHKECVNKARGVVSAIEVARRASSGSTSGTSEGNS